MHAKIWIARITAVCLLLGAAGCAATHEPYRWSKAVTDMPENVYGSWIWITWKASVPEAKPDEFGGELIAVSKDSIYIAAPMLRIIPRNAVLKAKLNQYDPYNDGVATLSILGGFTTLSNGWFLLLTWPMWILGGTITATARSYTPVLDYPGDSLEAMSLYARYPAGLPPALDRSKLTMAADKRKLFGF